MQTMNETKLKEVINYIVYRGRMPVTNYWCEHVKKPVLISVTPSLLLQ